MAGFKTHITTSSVLGVGYAGLGVHLGVPMESSLIAGGLCGVGGMLPDIDSDSGIPFRESMGFAAAIIPIMLLDRFREFGMNYEQIVLATGAVYLFVRFALARMLAKYTVHRGMFHSIPAAFVFAGVVFLLSGSGNLHLRYFKACGVFLGVMSHLVLDEIYAVEWARGRWRFKKSFGTALKLWSKNGWSNVSTYGKLVIVVMMILGEPMVMERYGHSSPLANSATAWTTQFAESNPFGMGGDITPVGGTPPTTADDELPEVDRTIYDTARRLWSKLRE